MNAMKLDWNDGNFLSEEELRHNQTRLMAVGDDYVTSLAIIPVEMSYATALEEYASTYEARNVGDEIKVSWVLYDGGEEVATGSWKFAARRGN